MNEKNYLTEHIDSLGPDLKEAVLSIDYLGALRKIQRDKKLHIDQAASMEQLTFMLILGEIQEEQYLSRLANDLNITPQEAEDIGGEVQGEILDPVIERFQSIEKSPIDAETEKPKDYGGSSGGTYQTDHSLSNVSEKAPLTDQDPQVTAEDILADIENPHPTVALAVSAAALPPTFTKDLSSPAPTRPETASTETKTPEPATSSATPIAIKTEPSAAAIPEFEKHNLSQTPLISPEVISVTLQKNLTEAVSSKPARITTSIDPYLEPIQ